MNPTDYLLLSVMGIAAASLGGIIHLHWKVGRWITQSKVADENHRLRIERLEKHTKINGLSDGEPEQIAD